MNNTGRKAIDNALTQINNQSIEIGALWREEESTLDHMAVGDGGADTDAYKATEAARDHLAMALGYLSNACKALERAKE